MNSKERKKIAYKESQKGWVRADLSLSTKDNNTGMTECYICHQAKIVWDSKSSRNVYDCSDGIPKHHLEHLYPECEECSKKKILYEFQKR